MVQQIILINPDKREFISLGLKIGELMHNPVAVHVVLWYMWNHPEDHVYLRGMDWGQGAAPTSPTPEEVYANFRDVEDETLEGLLEGGDEIEVADAAEKGMNRYRLKEFSGSRSSE